MKKKMLIEVLVPKQNKEIIELIADGYSVREISDLKKINRRTLESKLDRMRISYGCINLPNLVATFLREGLIK
jgi:DNA-binding CsgD family transcriptional regulator